jgi:apolipoprotein D and lipocalin family protein
MIPRYIKRMLGSSLLGLLGCSAQPPLKTVEQVDLQRYAGTWYEIASFPNRFQAGCPLQGLWIVPAQHQWT